MADEKTNASGKDIAVVSQDNSGQGRGVPDGNSPVERVTLDEMIDKARFIDENAEEPPEVERQICAMAERIISISKQGKPIRIVTDYDADGICFAYIMDKTLHKLNPNIDLKVICNDRRNPYGVPKSLVPEPNAQYIVGDMGSNELSYIWKTFGEGTLVIDHHLIEDSKDKELFNRESNLLNPHSISCADGKTAEYCATGLAYRVCNDYLVSQDQTQSVIAFSELSEINSIRKNMKSEIMDKRYYDFVEAQRFGSSKDDAIAIYMLDMDKPHSMCGLIAGALSEAIDKPAIVLAMKYDEETKTTGISGSARNSPRMESLKAFMDFALSQADEQLEVRYGGHENALGFSSINNFELFKKAIMEHQHELKERDIAPLRLEISPDELSSQSTLDKLMKLEPLGEGFKLPPVEISGKELRRTQNFIKQNPRWKHITVKDCVSVTDWCYSPEVYPPDSAGRIRLLAELNVNDYYGLKVEASAVFNRSFLAELQKELEQTAPKKQIDKSKA